jgi:hypothetical protein
LLRFKEKNIKNLVRKLPGEIYQIRQVWKTTRRLKQVEENKLEKEKCDMVIPKIQIFDSS